MPHRPVDSNAFNVLSQVEDHLPATITCERVSDPNGEGFCNVSYTHNRGLPKPRITEKKMIEEKKRSLCEEDRESKRIRAGPHGDAEVTPVDAMGESLANAGDSLPGSRRSQSPTTEYVGTKLTMRRGREPLKKRKKHLDVLLRNGFETLSQQHQEGQFRSANQISPVSSSSSQPNNYKQPESSNEIATTINSLTTESYDLREVQTLTEANRISDTSEIIPRIPLVQNKVSYHLVANFPQVLYHILSDTATQSETTGSVLQWLPHGRAWRVLRWDLVRIVIIPRFFPELCYENDGPTSGESIDAFLWNVRSWNFQEINDGLDAGAYAHKHFVRDMPSLYKEMKCPLVNSSINAIKSQNNSNQSVKMMSIKPGAEKIQRVPSFSKTKFDIHSRDTNIRESPSRNVLHTWDRHHQFHSEDVPFTNRYPPYFRDHHPSWQYSVNRQGENDHDKMCYLQQSGPRIIPSYESVYDGRFPLRPWSDYNNITPSIRSGRGGGRLPASGKNISLDQNYSRVSPQMIERSNFPVSQRGRASRACRTPAPFFHHLSNQLTYAGENLPLLPAIASNNHMIHNYNHPNNSVFQDSTNL
eukprot:CAMPEP_0194187546 /NCGR_PEP_ID=MMETSP0154-20130528/51357_1 /TAXON_ID=1049557 /ORGANISM="Thalassiothrix antarctica, Strain L6-D1" /LENGTH=585 /DNA_ID=CAMNT_0038907343 /DNA_START=151 /DNA_END=1908 /DNA_ORIENTATION=+